MEKEEEKANIIHSIALSDLFGFLKRATCVDAVVTYMLPKRAADYKGKAAELIGELVSYHKGDESWRIKKEKTVQAKTGEDSATLGNRTVYDAEMVLALAGANSFFVVPGPKSIERGGFNPAEVVQLSGLITLRPLLLHLSDEPVDEKDGVWRLTGTLKELQ